MTTYGGVTFTVKSPNGLRPQWSRESNFTRTHLPYSDRDDIQWSGLGNWTITVIGQFSSSTDLPTLIGLMGPTARELAALFGDTFPSVRLLSIRPGPGAVGGGHFEAELLFDRGGS